MGEAVVDAARIELAVVRADATAEEVHGAITRAAHGGHPAVIVPPVWVARAVATLRGSGTAVGTVAGYPLGLGKATIKAIEATSALKDGAAIVDVTVYLPPLLAGDAAAVRAELLEINRAARAANRDAVVRAAVDVPRLCRAMPAAEAAALACRAVREGGGDGVVVSGVDEATIRLVRSQAEGLGVVAVVDAFDAAAAQMAAGADRVRVAT